MYDFLDSSPDIIYRIFKQANAGDEGLIRKDLLLPGAGFDPAPVGVVGEMVEGLRVGHQAEDAAGGIAKNSRRHREESLINEWVLSGSDHFETRKNNFSFASNRFP